MTIMRLNKIDKCFYLQNKSEETSSLS